VVEKNKNYFMTELLELINQINTILPQISDFINQFNTTIIENNINVVTDTGANMFMDVPSDISDDKAAHLKKKLEIIDRLINTKTDEVEELLKKGSSLESTLKKNNPEYKSVILDKLSEFNKLKSSYKH
jgi:hypothetical protein